MRFSFCIALCALALSFGSRAAQAAGIYSYAVGSLPSSLGSCDAAKSYVSGRFATVTGLTPTRVECDANVDPLLGIVYHYDVNVFYRAERRLRLVSIGTAKQGIALDASYSVRIRHDKSANDLVKALNRLDGVQSVQLVAREEADARP